jgi:glycosyltransferase involved in cell wall biosynthesis
MPTEKAYGVQVVKMCGAFAALGCDVELLFPHRRQTATVGEATIWEYYGVEPTFQAIRLPTPDFIPLERFVPSWAMRLLYHLQSTLLGLTALIHVLRRPADLYFTRELWVAFIFASLGLNTVYEEHTAPRSPLRKRALLYAARRLRGVVAVTDSLAEHLAGIGLERRRLCHLPDAVDWQQFALTLSPDEARRELDLPGEGRLALYSGQFTTMGREKGIEDLIRALSLLPPDVKVVLVGSGQQDVVARYRQLAGELGIGSGRLIFVGQVRHKLVPRYLQAADILVVPFPRVEHFARFASPLKLFEYMASGRPIVASDLPAHREVLRQRENALLVPPEDPQALAGAIQELLADPDLGRRLGAQAREEVRQYNWERRAGEILDFAGVHIDNQRPKCYNLGEQVNE